ncbi:hypothetical protein JRC04_16100 [Mycolicibacterium sp. S2-37]|uniref:hypothetical protein n=1 Tax=Mycolicibacterium sp. S2-37 TaxID=2810297 RepID=UPI001A948699|nr:hypothetical protein [Mycolicibacterium sp. S2-37]MBO0678990.1 hypothetical protein [Mycolicibacterium sp. S2-37]
MDNRVVRLIGAASLLVMGSIGLASPAAADTTWEMPDVEGAVLHEAWGDVVSTTEGALLPETTTADGTPYEQINLTNWVVCSQSPAEGEEISAQEPPELEVARLNGC